MKVGIGRPRGRPRTLIALVAALTVAMPVTAAAGTVVDEGTLRVSGVFEDGSAVPDNALVRIDGAPAGSTDGSGTATVTWPAGPARVEVVLPSLAGGSATATVVAGETTDVRVVLRDGEGVYEPATLTMDELANGGLDTATPSVTLRFRQDGEPVPVAQVQLVTVATAADEERDLTSLFGVDAGGAVLPTNPATVLAALAALQSDQVSLHVEAVDSVGLSYAGTLSFVRGLATVTVVLRPPPSKPDLAVGSIEVATRYGTVDATVTTDATGRLVLERVPTGPLGVTASVTVDGSVFTAAADLVVAAGGHTLTVPVRGTADVLAGVAPWTFTSGSAAAPAAARSDRPVDVPARAPIGTAAVTRSASAVVSSAALNVPQVRTSTATVTKGTTDIVLAYMVDSREYPIFVVPQSRNNDIWSVTVLGPAGQVLFAVNRDVNSQLDREPIWYLDPGPVPRGITGQLRQELDISRLTADADIALTLVVTSTNIGSAGGTTTVDASLGAFTPTFSVRAVRPDVVPQRPGGRSDRFSIPRTGGANTFQRTIDIDYSHAANVAITRVRVDLVNRNNSLLQTIVNAPLTDPAVTTVDTDTLRVRVTYGGGTLSTIAGVPPPTDIIRYRVTLTGQRSDGATGSGTPFVSPDYHALWRMPDGFDRYSQPSDVGGDDWASRATYNWLSNNRALVTRINDISGEHGRDIGHATHLEGNDIDLYHVYHFPNNPQFSGTRNFYRLVEDTRAAMAGDAEARARVQAWATQTRARFDLLIANASTERIYYAVGAAMPGRDGVPALARGWARDLLQNGSYTTATGQQLNLGIGVWANTGHAKMRYNEVHDNHFHVTLVG